jgi:hypothetical protein
VRARRLLCSVLIGSACEACSIFTDVSGLSGGGGDGGALDGGRDSSLVSEGGGDGSPGGDAAPDAPTVVSYRGAVLADKPIAYLRFGESSGTLASDETGNGNSAAVSGTVTWGVSGALGSDKDTAIRLDGTTSLIDLGTKIDFLGTSPFSLELWFNMAAADSTYRFLVAKDARPGTGREEWGLVIHAVDGFYFERYVADQGRGVGAIAASILGRWVHAVATYDGKALELFVDGVSVDKGADARSQLPKNVPLTVGAASPGGGNVINGAIDELAIYDFALPAERIKAHFDAASGK